MDPSIDAASRILDVLLAVQDREGRAAMLVRQLRTLPTSVLRL